MASKRPGFARSLSAFAILLLTLTAGAKGDSETSEESDGEAMYETPAPPVAARRCYVCGPMAAQPHRSRRPPTCRGFTDAGGLVEDCDAGLNYCASIVTFEPYTTSRVCVHQLETYCTKRWCTKTNKTLVTCSCPGDLCNGENTRVHEAVTLIKERLSRVEREISLDPEHLAHGNASSTVLIDVPTSTTMNHPTKETTSTVPMMHEDHDDNHSIHDIHNHHSDKDPHRPMADDPHSGKPNADRAAPFDYDEESEDEEEGSGRSAGTEGKNERKAANEGAETGKRQATSTVAPAPQPNAARTVNAISAAVLWTVAVCAVR